MSDIVKQMVSNALWGGTGGGGLPTGGEPHQMLVTDKDGTATWQELLCYAEQEKVTVLPETVLTEAEGTFMGDTPLERDIVVGDVYTITYNGVDYQCTAYAVDGYAFGNLGALGGGLPVSNAPFVLLLFPPEWAAEVGASAMLIVLDGASDVTISVSTTREVVKKLDAKYAPGEPFGDFPYADRVFLRETTFENPSSAGTSVVLDNPLVNGQTYTITCDGVEYTSTARIDSNNGYIAVGQWMNEDDCPVGLLAKPGSSGGMLMAWESPETLTISIVGSGTETIKISGKYIDKYNEPYIVTAHIDGNRGASTFTLESVEQTYEEIEIAHEVEKRPVFCMLVNSDSNGSSFLLPLVEKSISAFVFAQTTWPGQHGGIPNLKLTITDDENTLETVTPSFGDLITYSPSGTAYKITVSDDGTLSATAL